MVFSLIQKTLNHRDGEFDSELFQLYENNHSCHLVLDPLRRGGAGRTLGSALRRREASTYRRERKGWPGGNLLI